MNKKLSIFFWYTLGSIFFISAISKGVDIFAFSAKIKDYIHAFGMQLPDSLYEIVAISTVGGELLLSLYLLNGIAKRITYYLTIIVLIFFTTLTFVVAVKGNIFDCGCFGSFWNMSPWASFIKNLIIMFIALLAYPQVNVNIQKKFIKAAILYALIVVIYCVATIINQPIIDSNYYTEGSILTINENNQTSVDVEFRPIEPIDKSRIGIVRDFNSMDDSFVASFIKYVETDSSHGIILTSTNPDEINFNLLPKVVVGFVDNSLISKLISGNKGVIELEDATIVYKWQQDYLHLSDYKHKDKLYTTFSITVYWSITLLLWIVIIHSIIISVKRGSRKTYQRVGNKNKTI